MKKITMQEAMHAVADGKEVVVRDENNDKLTVKLSSPRSLSVFTNPFIVQYYLPTTIEHAVFKYTGPAAFKHEPEFMTVHKSSLQDYSISRYWEQVSPWVTVELEV